MNRQQAKGIIETLLFISTRPLTLERLREVFDREINRTAIKTILDELIAEYQESNLQLVESGGVLRTLLEKKLVKVLGRKNVPGKPLMYGSTWEFLQYFGLKDLSELPSLKDKELQDPAGPAESVVQPLCGDINSPQDIEQLRIPEKKIV